VSGARRVVVTGLGLVTPVGIGVEATWSSLVAGRGGVARITRFDTTGYDVHIAAEVKGFVAADWMDRQQERRMDLFVQYALAAAAMALRDAGLAGSMSDEVRDRTGVIIGSGIGGLPTIEATHARLVEKGPSRVSPFFIPGVIGNMAAGMVSIVNGLRGPNSSTCTACATGTHAVGDAFRVIQRGEADVMLSGGTDGVICPLGVAGFAAMRALSTRNDDPDHASRPFDAGRDGFVMGEGAGVLVLEERERAVRRGARIYCEVAGYGMSADAHHVSAPLEDGSGARRVMAAALKDAGVAAERVTYVNAHGTSTPLGDLAESRALRATFGPHADRLMVSSTKSMVGHLLGAAGGVEAAVTALSVHHGLVHPTANLVEPGEGCDLDFVPGAAREVRIDHALSNSFGFGGTNAALLFGRHA
jgi:3-oxoacyl-[acyl-carrier-protein] synthase II